MRELTLRPFLTSHLGFDRLFEELESAVNNRMAQPNYPPFNIFKEEDGYTVEVAVAGFKKSDIKIMHNRKASSLEIYSDKIDSDVDDKQVIRKGLARRSFNLSFRIAPDLEVHGASLEDGILTINLKTIEREEDKPLLIAIK